MDNVTDMDAARWGASIRARRDAIRASLSDVGHLARLSDETIRNAEGAIKKTQPNNVVAIEAALDTLEAMHRASEEVRGATPQAALDRIDALERLAALHSAQIAMLIELLPPQPDDDSNDR